MPDGTFLHGLQELAPKIDAMTAKGMSREQVRDAFVAEHGGQDILTAPIDTGFNRLAWFFPSRSVSSAPSASSSPRSAGRTTSPVRARPDIPQDAAAQGKAR